MALPTRRSGFATRNPRPTRGLREVFEALDGRDVPATAQNLFIELRANGSGLGLATVYRALHVLCEQGLLHEFPAADGTAFRACGRAPHQHLVCRECGRVQEQRLAAPSGWLAEVERGGFVVDTCSIKIRGVCERCRASGPTAP